MAVDTRFARLAVDTTFARLTVAIALDKYPAVPKPITVLVRFAVVRAPMIFVAWMEETRSCWALIVMAYWVPTLICIVLKLVAITSPISTKALFEPRNSESTVREEIYPWTEVIF